MALQRLHRPFAAGTGCGHRPRVLQPCPAAQAAGPAPAKTMMRISPDLLAAGGIDVSKESPQSLESLGGFLRTNFVPVDLSYPGIHIQNIDPPILTIDSFLSPEQCDALIESARSSNRMARSAVGGNTDGSDIRTSSTLAITSQVLQECPALKDALDAMLHNASSLLQLGPAGFSLSNVLFIRPSRPGQITCELPQVAHYTHGQHFLSHEDAFPVAAAVTKGYQRRATLLVYLNDVPAGGTTHFDILEFGIQPQKGKALLFFPSFANGVPDHRTLHTATDAVEDKWVSQLWVSCGVQRPAQPPGNEAAGAGAAKKGASGPIRFDELGIPKRKSKSRKK